MWDARRRLYRNFLQKKFACYFCHIFHTGKLHLDPLSILKLLWFNGQLLQTVLGKWLLKTRPCAIATYTTRSPVPGQTKAAFCSKLKGRTAEKKICLLNRRGINYPLKREQSERNEIWRCHLHHLGEEWNLWVYDLKGIILLKMIDYPNKVCNTSTTDAFFIVSFSENSWNLVQKDANEIEGYTKTYACILMQSAKEAFVIFIHLIGSPIVRIFVDHWRFECRCH